MEEKKMFPRVGARDIRMVATNSTKISNAKNCYCPSCGAGPMDGCTGISMEIEGRAINSNSAEPNCGDYSICSYCGSLVVYQKAEDGTMSLRNLNRTDISHIKDNDPDMWCALMKAKDLVVTQIEKQQIDGDRRYGGKCTKSIIK